MNRDTEETFFNRSLERALCILNAFDTETTTYTPAQLSAKLSLSRATVLRLCSTLVKYNFLKQERESKRYSLGLRLFELGSLVFYSFTLKKIITDFLSQFRVKLDGSLFLEFLERGELLDVNQRGNHGEPIEVIERHSPGNINNRMNALPSAQQTAAVDRPGGMMGERICAYVVLKPDATLNHGEGVAAYLKKEGAFEQQAPWRIEFLEGALNTEPVGPAERTSKKISRTASKVRLKDIGCKPQGTHKAFAPDLDVKEVAGTGERIHDANPSV